MNIMRRIRAMLQTAAIWGAAWTIPGLLICAYPQRGRTPQIIARRSLAATRRELGSNRWGLSSHRALSNSLRYDSQPDATACARRGRVRRPRRSVGRRIPASRAARAVTAVYEGAWVIAPLSRAAVGTITGAHSRAFAVISVSWTPHFLTTPCLSITRTTTRPARR